MLLLQTKDELIFQYYQSCKTFESNYTEMCNSLDAETTLKNMEICNQAILAYHTMKLVNKGLTKLSFRILFLSKTKALTLESYDAISDYINQYKNSIYYSKNKNNSLLAFINKYKVVQKKILTKLNKTTMEQLKKYTAKHNLYGTLSLFELLNIATKLNYIAVDTYQKTRVKKFTIAM